MTQKLYMDITVTDIVQEYEKSRGFLLQKFCIYFDRVGQYRRCDCREVEYRVSADAGYAL